MKKLFMIGTLLMGFSVNAVQLTESIPELNCIQQFSPGLTVNYFVSVSPIEGSDDLTLDYTQIPAQGFTKTPQNQVIAHHTDQLNYIFDNGIFEIDPTLTFATFAIDGDVAAMVCEEKNRSQKDHEL